MSTDVAVLDNKTDLSPWQVAPAQTPQFSGIARHHRKAFEDYNIARAHILQAVGDIDDLELFGSRILLAVFCKPNIRTMKRADGTETMWIDPLKLAKEDWYQGKAAMILRMGPDAFCGNEAWDKSIFGSGAKPQVGDWVFANASAGTQLSMMGEGASRPQGRDMQGQPIDIYDWDGWPCRIVDHMEIYGRLLNPQLTV